MTVMEFLGRFDTLGMEPSAYLAFALNNKELFLAYQSVLLVLAIAAFVFYCLTLQKALRRCAPENRAMKPGLIWLLVIPYFHVIWHFFVVINMAKSIDRECIDKNISHPQNPGLVWGMVASVVMTAAYVMQGIQGFFMFLNVIAGVTYWTQIARYSRMIARSSVESASLRSEST